MSYKERYDAVYKETKNAEYARFAALYNEPKPVSVTVHVVIRMKFMYVIIALLTVIALKGTI